MSTKQVKVTKNPKKESTNQILGFMPEWVEDASIGDENPINKKYIYKKLKKPLVIESNNSKKEVDVYFSSAEKEDLNKLLNYLLPKNKI